jgi:hypothetical protein
MEAHPYMPVLKTPDSVKLLQENKSCKTIRPIGPAAVSIPISYSPSVKIKNTFFFF